MTADDYHAKLGTVEEKLGGIETRTQRANVEAGNRLAQIEEIRREVQMAFGDVRARQVIASVKLDQYGQALAQNICNDIEAATREIKTHGEAIQKLAAQDRSGDGAGGQANQIAKL